MKNAKVVRGRIVDPRGLVVLRSPSPPSIDALLSALLLLLSSDTDVAGTPNLYDAVDDEKATFLA